LRWRVRRRVPAGWLQRWADLREVARRPLAGIPWRQIMLGVVPGLPQLLVGRWRVGWGLLVGWLVLVSAAVVLAGSWTGALFLSGAIVVHSISLQLVLMPQLRLMRWGGRFAVGLALFVALRLLVYEPPMALGSRFVRPVDIPADALVLTASGLAADDILLVTGPWLRNVAPRPGAIVLYRLRRDMVRGYFVLAGHGLDRLLAEGGQRLQLSHGTLSVDGRPLPPGRGPLGPLDKLPDLDITLAPGEVGVIPSVLRMRPESLATEQGRILWERVCRVPSDAVEGRAVWRLWPPHRFGPLS